MKFIVPSQDLLERLLLVNGAVVSKPVLPILENFLFKIKEKYPLLTNKDVQLAVQVKLKLSSKEIANINNITLNSVEIGRHRLRKKLGLNTKDNLVRFLEKI